jgi:hypothetical protein
MLVAARATVRTRASGREGVSNHLGPGPFVLALEDAVRTFTETVIRDLKRDFEDPESPPSPHCWDGIAVMGDGVHADLAEGAIELYTGRLNHPCPRPARARAQGHLANVHRDRAAGSRTGFQRS